MAKRGKAVAVTLTDVQRERLERLWFVYGNYGPKTTPGNHQFIQALLEHGLDLRPLQTKRTPKSERPTPECEAAVGAVLAMGSDLAESDPPAGRFLRLVRSAGEELARPTAEPELKEFFDDMRRRYRVHRERESSAPEDDEAA